MKIDKKFPESFTGLSAREQFVENLIGRTDEKFQNFHHGLCPGKDNILGIRVPVLREFAKQENRLCEERVKEELASISDGEKKTKQEVIIKIYEQYFQKYEFVYAEEAMLFGYIISYMKADYDTRLYFLPQYVSHIDSWAVCDSPIGSMKWIAKNKAAFWDYLEKHYMYSDKEYELRFAIVVMLNYYVEEAWIDKVLSYLDTVHMEAYYVKMAVAWAVSVCFIKYPERTKDFLLENQLDEWTFRKSLSKITDSFRVSAEDKVWIRNLRGESGKNVNGSD